MSSLILKYIILLILLFLSVRISANLHLSKEDKNTFKKISPRSENKDIDLRPIIAAQVNQNGNSIKNLNSIQINNHEFGKENGPEISQNSFIIDNFDLNSANLKKENFKNLSKNGLFEDIGGVEVLESIM